MARSRLAHFFAYLFLIASTLTILTQAQENDSRSTTADAKQDRDKGREKDFEKGEDGRFMRKRRERISSITNVLIRINTFRPARG
jgi:hypothetical protein